MNWWPKFRNARSFIAPTDVLKNLMPEEMRKYDTKKLSCFNRVIGCTQLYEVPSGKYATKGGKIEYETMACCGSNTGVLDPEAIYLMDTLADQYGMDSIEMGHVIGFAKKLYEKGMITKEDTDGLALDWENVDVTIELIHKIANRKGFGDILAEGCYNYTRTIGNEAMKYCFHNKGIIREPPRTALVGLLYATSTRGADHLRGEIICSDSPYNMEYVKKLEERGLVPKDIAGKAILGQRAFLIGDILTRCKCGVYTWPAAVPLIFEYPLFEGSARLISAATGWDLSADELVKILDRIYTFERAYIVRQGITRKNDIYSLRPEKVGTSGAEEELKKHEELLDEYYELRGWDIKTGIPTRETLEKLKLKYVADELEGNGPYPEWEGPPLGEAQTSK